MCNVLGAEDMFGEDPADVFLYFRLSIFCPFLWFFFAIACAMSWDGEHVWGRPTHRIHRACRIGPLLSIQRHLISYNQLTYKRFKEHSNSKLNQVVQC